MQSSSSDGHHYMHAPLHSSSRHSTGSNSRSALMQSPPASWNQPTPIVRTSGHRTGGLVLDAGATIRSSGSVESAGSSRRSVSYHNVTTTADRSNHSQQRQPQRIRARVVQQQPHLQLPDEPQSQYATQQTASTWAQSCHKAGYLEKLGQNVTVWKRRFFLLQPGTHLYYFVSPTDTEPRGCLDVEGSTVQISLQNPTQLALTWPNDRPQERVVLQAKTPELAQEWKEVLETERLSVTKELLYKERRQVSASRSRVAELEATIKTYKLIEQERDLALKDIDMWKDRFDLLDEACRLLTKRLKQHAKDKVMEETAAGEPEEGVKGVASDDDKTTSSSDANGDNSSPDAPSLLEAANTSLLDESIENEDIDLRTIPGRHFSALHNICEHIQENYELAAKEAATAVEDLVEANQQVEAVEKRMVKAEKHLCKLWEENCSLRETLKQKKREKVILVREVKSLQEAAKQHEESVKTSAAQASTGFDSDGEKMIDELEEEIMSSIRMHERFMASGGPRFAKSTLTTSNHSSGPLPQQKHQHPPPPKKNLVSLFDSGLSSDDEDDREVKDESAFAGNGASAKGSIVSSVGAEYGDDEQLDPDHLLPTTPNVKEITIVSESPSPVRLNPLDQLDKDDDDEAVNRGKEPERPSITMNGAATSSLTCPLADVISTSTRTPTECTQDGLTSLDSNDLEVYHLTFYSRKIGIQFQKIPPLPAKPKGLLTEAMTVDLSRAVSGGADKTAAELRRIAAFSPHTKSGQRQGDEVLQVLPPVDAVVVCGFLGFDASGSNQRPKLGARLVAFDGVSVEVGPWTFESIRKSIQARSRPLTLSFRNDFLNADQRQVLTRAVREVEARAPPPPKETQKAVQRRPKHHHGRTMSLDSRSIHSALSGETDQFIGGHIDGRTTPNSLPNNTVTSVDCTSLSGGSSHPKSFSGTKSLSTAGFRSFSEAGSSVSMLSSAVGPLVTNLLNRRSSRGEPFSPDYLRRTSENVECTPQHKEFQSGLL